MRAACLIVLISTVSCICVSFCFPSKPLDERSTELAWEAWLLVDQGNKQGNLGLLPRRITPKSVFIAPTFSPDSLPACAEGYKSDSMGRCVKIIKINESIHYDFLLQQLNEQYPSYDDEPEETTVSGPFQVNIPFFDNEKAVEHDGDVAIIVTPTSKHHHTASRLNVNANRNGADKFNVESVAAILRVNPSDVEMTTMAELITTTLRSDPDTTIETQTTTESVETTEPTTATTESTETTTLLEREALFFQLRF